MNLRIGSLLSVFLFIFGCTNIMQDRGPALRPNEDVLTALKAAEDAKNAPPPKEYIGYQSATLGKAVVFIKDQTTSGSPIADQAIVVYFGQSFIDEGLAFEPPAQVIDPFPTTSICSHTENFDRAAQDRSVLGVSPGFPNCQVRAGRFIFDCTYWGYLMLSVSKSAIAITSATSNVINLPRSNVSLATMADNFIDPKAKTPAVCRAVSIPLAGRSRNLDFIILENTDIKGLCPVLEREQPRFPDMMVDFRDDTIVPAEEPYEGFGLTFDTLIQATNRWAIPTSLVSPVSPFSQDLKFGQEINKEFVNFFLTTGLLYPTITFQEVDPSEAGDLSINIHQLNLPNLKLFYPNSGQFDSENRWNNKYDDLIIQPEENLPLHPRHWVDNLSDSMLSLCAELYIKTEFVDPDIRRVEPTPTPDPNAEDEDSEPDLTQLDSAEEIPEDERFSN
jgi:hypothetical protein